MNPPLRLYALFHLNLAFSSIEEEHRSRVLERCYWPLLDLIRRRDLPIAIEAPGYTLEEAARLDPAWIGELRALVHGGRCEVVGSGYAQLIGPLVPAAVNAANQRLGMESYERLLFTRPRIAWVNEQAWSASLVRHYVEAGYRGVMMEWDNPAASHPEWPAEVRYQPQVAVGQDGAELPLLWNHSIAFQKFQRFAHGELELDEYLDYLRSHQGQLPRVFTLYGSDAEVFDYRPGRYRTEAALGEPREWARIEELCVALLKEREIELVSPSAALACGAGRDAGQRLSLESAELPIPVKKQPKYHLARWAVTGRDDLGINTTCWRAYERLREMPREHDDDWRELCYLWGSDFRTHLTKKRWQRYTERLAAFVEAIGVEGQPGGLFVPGPAAAAGLPPEIDVQRSGRWLTIATPGARLRLNCRRGLAIDALSFTALGEEPLVGSLPHGYFDDIEWSADQYTGFLVHAAAGQPQVADLEPTEPIVEWRESTGQLIVHGCIATPLGSIQKEIAISVPAGRSHPRVAVRHRLLWQEIPLGTLRLGHVTLIPTAFDARTLYVATHNGGPSLERFALGGAEVDQLSPVSHLVSCRSGLGATEGVVVLGDERRGVRIEIDKGSAALFPMLSLRWFGGRYFCRITLSARELDDTSRHECNGRSRFVDTFGFAITPAA